jgi:hypothetical protein
MPRRVFDFWREILALLRSGWQACICYRNSARLVVYCPDGG